MWYNDSVFYQIYPLGFCGAPELNDGTEASRIGKIAEWIPHMKSIGIDALYLCPLFESDAHGYDTRDYARLDRRLGSNEDFAEVCAALHEDGIRVVLDGVFNHVGRGFWAFRDVLERREASPYKDWFYIDFSGNSCYGDGFKYEGWEGHYNLVRLNLRNPEVVEHLFTCIEGWVRQFGIDGLRLDVAYLLDKDFLRRLRAFCKSLKPDFFLIGEVIHGDYNSLVSSEMLDSCTNYECYKGIYSSFNDRNMFEIAYSLNRQFGHEHWSIYKGLPLLSFAENHDVNRLASILKEPRNLNAAYGLLFGMPGIPCVYCGGEWGAKGEKVHGSDAALRPCYPAPVFNETGRRIAFMSKMRRENPALRLGGYRQLYLTNLQFAFLREYKDNRVIVAVNADAFPHSARLPVQGVLKDLMSGENASCFGSVELPAFSAGFYRLE